MLKKIKDYLFSDTKIFTRLEMYSFVLVFTILGFVLFALLNIQISYNKDWIEIIKACASVLILFSIIMAILNYSYTKKWNQRNSAIIGLHESQEKLASSIRYLDKQINLTKHFETKNTYDVVFLHNCLGVFKDDNSFVFHGEHTGKEIIKRVDNKEYRTMFVETIKGRKIYDSIESYLNEVEYLATACKMEIFDKKTIYELKGSGLISGYIVFKNLIYHNRFDMRHGYGPTLYENFENLVFEFADMRGIILEVPKEVEYLTPFDRK